jgi:hypothetical protein
MSFHPQVKYTEFLFDFSPISTAWFLYHFKCSTALQHSFSALSESLTLSYRNPRQPRDFSFTET